MMRRRDLIFWMATGLFVAALILAGTLGDGWLLLLVAAYLLRPTLHSLGFFPKLVDEREVQVQYRASNVGFAAMVAGVIVVIVVLMRRDDHTYEMLTAVLMVALAARALAGLLMNGDVAVIGPRILMAIGGFVALFGVLEGIESPSSLVAHVIPGFAVFGLGLAARRWPRPVAWAVLAVAAALFVGAAMSAFSSRPGAWGTTLALSLLAVPSAVAGIALLRRPSGDTDSASTRGATMLLLAVALTLPVAASAQDPRFDCKARSDTALGKDCRLLKEDTVYGRRMPAGAILHYDSAGTYTYFSLMKAERFEGFDLAGAHDGISQEVFPNGAPQALWLGAPQEVNSVPCRAFSVLGELFKRASRVRFHANGQFAGCHLSRDATVQGRALSRGQKVAFGPDGRLSEPAR